jgi:hypothetical protein
MDDVDGDTLPTELLSMASIMEGCIQTGGSCHICGTTRKTNHTLIGQQMKNGDIHWYFLFLVSLRLA